MTRRQATLIAVLAVLLAVLAGYSRQSLQAARAVAIAAETDLAACRKLARVLDTLDRDASRATDPSQRDVELRRNVERAAAAAGVPDDSLKRMIPESSTRVGDTPYKEHPTRIDLRNVTRRQIVTLLHSLLAAEDGLRIKTIRLTAPKPDDTTDLWNAEVLLTYLRYDPPTPAGRRGDTP